MDTCLKASLESILNVKFNENQWIQTGLPVSLGGLGIRKISDVSLPAFLSSLSGVRDLVSLILPNMDTGFTLHLWNESLEQWNSINNGKIPDNASIQKHWDFINLERIIAEDFHLETRKDIARFKALQEPESGQEVGFK